jgi:hypothetical protein
MQIRPVAVEKFIVKRGTDGRTDRHNTPVRTQLKAKHMSCSQDTLPISQRYSLLIRRIKRMLHNCYPMRRFPKFISLFMIYMGKVLPFNFDKYLAYWKEL